MAFLEDYPEANTTEIRTLGSKGCMVPYFALCLFAGIRPDWEDGEIGKIQPGHINLKTGVIHLEPEVSKVNEKRIIKIQPNLALWLERYPADNFPIIPPTSFREMRINIRRRFNLGYDILRHTFISMLVGAFRSVGDAALQAGSSESIIRRFYLDLKSEEAADDFWRISPAGTSLPAQL